MRPSAAGAVLAMLSAGSARHVSGSPGWTTLLTSRLDGEVPGTLRWPFPEAHTPAQFILLDDRDRPNQH